MSVIACAAADKNYFPILAEWLHSLRRVRPDYAVGILNVGMSAKQIDYLKEQGCQIVTPDWPCKIPEWKIRGREYLKGCVCRPFLPDYFPGFDIILWMDSDMWVQNDHALDLYIAGAQKGALTITPQMTRTPRKVTRLSWLGALPYKPRSFYYSNAKKAFSGKMARALFPYPTVNAGIFSLPANAPHWQRWQELVVQALKKGKVFTAEQLCLGIMIYLENFQTEFLPSWCNWLCEDKPLWDRDNQQFVEPYMPYEPISIMHLSGWDEMRVNRAVTTEFKTLSGETITKSYRYPALDGETLIG